MPNLSITISNENFIRVVELASKEAKEKKQNISATINEILDGFFGKKERKK